MTESDLKRLIQSGREGDIKMYEDILNQRNIGFRKDMQLAIDRVINTQKGKLQYYRK